MITHDTITLLVRILLVMGLLCLLADPTWGTSMPTKKTPWVDALEVLFYADFAVTLLNGMMLLGHQESEFTGGFGVFLGGATLAVSAGALFLEDTRERQNEAFTGLLVGGITLGMGLANTYGAKKRASLPVDDAVSLSPALFRGVDGKLLKGFVFTKSF